MREPGEGRSGNDDAGTASGRGCNGGGVIPRGDSVSEYGGAWSVIGGIGLRPSAWADRPPDELLPVSVVPAE